MRPSPSRSSTLPEADPTLSWVDELFCPPGSGLRLVGDTPRRTHAIARWVALPSLGDPRLLAPTGGPAASAALQQFNDSMTQTARIRKWAIGQTLRLGAGSLKRRQHVALAGSAERPDLDLFGSVLPEMLGEPLVPAVMLGAPRRPNAKPVLQLSRPDGRVLAYAKIGWNDLTRTLIANELEALASWERHPPATFAVPRPIGNASWHGLSIVLVSPVPHRVLRSGPRNTAPPTRTAHELAAHEGIEEVELANAPYVTRLEAESDRLDDELIQAAARSAIAATIDRDGGRKVAVGTAHGDWGPWNMSRVGSTLHIWDWERTATGVPIGIDLLHLHVQVSVLGSERSVRASTSLALARSRDQLVELGVDPGVHRSLMDLYLVERLLRLAAGRAAGVPVRQGLLSDVIEVLGRGGTT